MKAKKFTKHKEGRKVYAETNVGHMDMFSLMQSGKLTGLPKNIFTTSVLRGRPGTTASLREYLH